MSRNQALRIRALPTEEVKRLAASNGRIVRWLPAYNGWPIAFWTLLILLIDRLWVMPLASSFWIDEMGTAFAVRYGMEHPSFAVAPQLQTLYFPFMAMASKIFGFSEASYRIPSLIFMGLAIYLTARLAIRLIHPRAGWFAAFACLGIGWINYYAADARPYAMSTAAVAAAFFFLVQWLDSSRWRDAIAFIIAGALLLPVHLILWPFYLAFAIYAGFRLTRRDTEVRWTAAIGVFAALALSLIPSMLQALYVLQNNPGGHAYADMPQWRIFKWALNLRLVFICGVGAVLYCVLTRRVTEVWSTGKWISASAACLFFAYWVIQPVALYVFSHASGASVFIPRYWAAALPGCALVATAAAARFLSAESWRPATLILGLGVLLFLGDWTTRSPRHDLSDWRSAVELLHRTVDRADTPIVCPSPFVEGEWPAWRPDHALPSFLYSHLDIYPIPGKPYLFPYLRLPSAVPPAAAAQYAKELSRGAFYKSGSFLIYGGRRWAEFWRDWFSRQPELAGWQSKQLGLFGDVEVFRFERGL